MPFDLRIAAGDQSSEERLLNKFADGEDFSDTTLNIGLGLILLRLVLQVPMSRFAWSTSFRVSLSSLSET